MRRSDEYNELIDRYASGEAAQQQNTPRNL